MTKRTHQKGARTMSEWKERNRQAFVFVATAAYFTSLFLTWCEIRINDGSRPSDYVMASSDGLGIANSTLSELCVVIAVAILIVTATAFRSDDHRLPLARRQLAIALVIFNVLSVLELWRGMTGTPGDTHITYGAYVAIGTSLLVLLSVLVLDAGGLRELFRRIPRRLTDAPRSTEPAD
jgi:hypothetical protein